MTCDLGGAILYVCFSKLYRTSAGNNAFRITKPSRDYLHEVWRKKNLLLVRVFLSATISGYMPKSPENFLGNIVNLSLYQSRFVPTLLKLQSAKEILIIETYGYFVQIRDKTFSIGKLKRTLYPHTTHTLYNACPKYTPIKRASLIS